MNEVRDRLMNNRHLERLGVFGDIAVETIDNVLAPIWRIVNAALDVVFIREFSLTDFSLYGIATGTRNPFVVIDFDVCGYTNLWADV